LVDLVVDGLGGEVLLQGWVELKSDEEEGLNG
jgi:hypothetical protein